MRAWGLTIILTAVSFATVARAQTKDVPKDMPDTTNDTTNNIVAPTTVPEVADPMLTLPPGAPQKIESWAQALSYVRTRSPEYLTNLATIKRAQAQTRIALASLLPVVTGTGTYAHNFYQVQIPFGTETIVTPPPDALNVAALVTWTPLNVRAIYDYETTRRNVEATKLSFEDERRQLAQGLVSAILSTLSSARVAELNRVGLRASLERLHLTEARLQFGQGTPLDVDRAKADVAASRKLIIDGDEILRRSRETLGLAIGSRDPVEVLGPFDVESFEHAVLQTCRLNDEIENRPDVRAARERLRIAKRLVTSPLLELIPTFGFVASAAYTTEPVLAPNGTFALEAVLTIPFYDGGARYGLRRDALGAEEQAAAALEQTRLDAIVSSARAQRAVNVARDDRDVSKTERDLEKQIDMRTRDAYARGRGTSLDLVTSAQDLRRAEITLAILDFQFDEARADAVLENAECTF